MQNILIIALIAVIAYFVYSKKLATARAKSDLENYKSLLTKSQYRCVMINTGFNTCKSAQAMRLKPILMNDAPVLPLVTCDSSHCDCSYSRHEDRRIEDRRAPSNAARQIIGEVNDFRHTKDRRRSIA